MELVRQVRAHHPKLPILVLSMHDETIYAERVLAAGADGPYVMKQCRAGGIPGGAAAECWQGKFMSVNWWAAP